jgi:hypothetical protein
MATPNTSKYAYSIIQSGRIVAALELHSRIQQSRVFASIIKRWTEGYRGVQVPPLTRESRTR